MKKIIMFLGVICVAGFLSAQMTSPQISYGNFSISSGAVYGHMGYDSAKDIATDGSYIYILAGNPSGSSYIIKYNQDGNVISTRTVGFNNGVNYNHIFISTESTAGIFVVGNFYSSNLSSNTVSIIRYSTVNLVMISSSQFQNPNVGLQFISGIVDKSANLAVMYACVDRVTGGGRNANIVKINLNDFSIDVSSYQFTDGSVCGRYIFKKDSTLYTLLNNAGQVYIATAPVSNILDQTISPLAGINGGSGIHFAANSSGIFAVFDSDSGSTQKRALYKYSYSDFSNFQSSSDITTDGTLEGAMADNWGIFVLRSVINPNNNISDFRISVFDPNTFSQKNEYIANVSDNSYPRKIISLYSVSGSTAYITGDTYICKFWGCDTDIRTVRFSNFNLVSNKQPILSFPSQYTITKGMEHGNVLILNQKTTFYVEYYDLDGDASSYVRIGIKGPNDNNYTYYDMSCISNCDPTNKMLFAYNTTVNKFGEYRYKFSAMDKNSNSAVGYASSEEGFKFVVLKGFEGSFGDSDKTVKITFPRKDKNEIAEYKIYSKGDDVYALINPNVSKKENGESNRIGAPSIIVKLSTFSEVNSYFYDLNYNWPNFNNRMGWVVYDLSFNESGNMEVFAASQTPTGSFEIFLATLIPTISNDTLSFTRVGTPLVLSTETAATLPDFVDLKIKNGKRYIVAEKGFAKCDSFPCTFYDAEEKLSDLNNPKIKAMDSYGDYVYLAGSYDSESSRIAFIVKVDGNLDNDKFFKFKGLGNTVFGEFKDILVKGNYIYALGEFKTATDNYGMILKLSTSSLEVVDSKIMNPGKARFDFIKDGGNYLLVAGIRKGMDSANLYFPFMIILDTQTLSYVNIFNDLQNSGIANLMDVNLSGSNVYYVKENYDEFSNLGSVKFVKANNILIDNRVNVSVSLKDTSGKKLPATEVSFVPFEEGKGDVGRSLIGLKTDNQGVLTAKVLKNIPYFIAVSTHGYAPNLRQQMFDPYKRFIRVFSSDSNISYNIFSQSKENLYKYSVVVSSLIKGMEVFGSIMYNNEPVALLATKAADSLITLEFNNLAQLEPNKYKLEISVPDLLNFTTPILSTTTLLIVDFSSATPPSYSYESVKAQPLLRGIVIDSVNRNPVAGAMIMISTYNNCFSWPKQALITLNTDPGGKFYLYPQNIPNNISNVCVDIKKEGYIYYTTQISIPQYLEQSFSLVPATYSISGYLTYKGNPLSGFKIEAGSYNQQEFRFKGTDSYCLPVGSKSYCGGEMSFVSASAVTDSKGYFVISGLKDGNLALYNTGSFWRNINRGADNQSQTSDDIRIVVSSSGAIPPSYPPDNICKPGKVWILDSDGRCIGIAPYTFDIVETMTENATLYLNVKYDVVGATDTSATLLIAEGCEEGKDCSKLKRIMISLPDNLTSGTTSYTINLSSGIKYYFKVISDRWAKRSIFDELDFTSTNTIRSEVILTRAGGLRIKVVKPDGSLFIPSVVGDKWPRFIISTPDKVFSYSSDFWVDPNNPNPVFEVQNLVPSRYIITFMAKGYPVTTMEDVNVEAGKVTEVKLRMKSGLVVRPNITSLQQSEYDYAVLAMPQGFEMKRSNINDLLFGEGMGERYVINYDTKTSLFNPKYLDEGRYDVYLVLASRYSPDDETHKSFRSFINFIGVEKGKVIQKNPQDPTYGTELKPISDFNIYGSLGKATLTGKMKGKKIISDKDFEKIFSGNLGHLLSLIPSVMLYDETGNIRAYSHCLMDSTTSFNSFMTAVLAKDTQTIVSVFNSSSSYFIPSLPIGKYTAVFLTPNYPPILKEIVINSTYTVFDIDFDAQSYAKTKLAVKVVVDGSTQPIKGARILLSHKAYEKVAYSNDNGEYVFEDIPTGLYRMEVFKDGYTVEGKKFSVGNEDVSYNIFLKPTQKIIKGKIYLSKFPRTSVSAGVEVTAYNESKIVQGSNYVPSIKALTDENGNYEIKGVEAGSTYRIVARYPGKLTQAISVNVSQTDIYTYADDIVFMDIPPQIDVKIRRYKNNLEIYIKSPKEISSVPLCEYLKGKYTLNNFDETNSTRLSLVALPNNAYMGRFNISALADYYTIRVKAGDVDVVEKAVVYDVKNDISVENYITDQIYVGGSVYADAENEDYTGIELDAGSLTQSTASIIASQSYGKMIKVSSVGDGGLIGGFFSALPMVRTTRTSKGEITVVDAIKSIMASDVYDISLSNVQPNREFTLTLKYDKEKVVGNTSSLKIYQYDEITGQWKEVKGTYTVDPMLGTVSVDVASISNAYESSGQDLLNPYIRKRFGMSAISGGKFVPQSTISSQSGRFAVFVAKPPTGTSYSGSSFDVYNIPNPFNLKSKTVNISSDGGSWHTGDYITEGTIIKYHLPAGKSGSIKFVIYNAAGEKVRTLDEGQREGGYVYYSEWDGRNDKNEKCASGVYFIVAYLNGEKIGKVHKMAIIK